MIIHVGNRDETYNVITRNQLLQYYRRLGQELYFYTGTCVTYIALSYLYGR
jgi:hypothetical protein